MPSPTFEAFYRNFSDNSSAAVREGLNLRALLALDGDEREAAENLLLARASQGDDRAMIGLGALRSKRAEPILATVFDAERDKAAGPGGRRLVEVSRALYRIRPDRRWLDAEIEVLDRSPRTTTQRAAAEALRDFHDPEAVRALVRALDARDTLVRHAAARSLLALHGVADDPNDYQHAIYRVMRDAEQRDAAKQELLRMIEGRPIEAG